MADIVTKARQSLHQSLLGCLAVALALGTLLAGILLLLVLTSLLWVPLVSGLVCSQFVSAISRNLITLGGVSVRRVRDKTLGLLGILVHKIEQWVTGKTAAGVADEIRRRRGHEAAIKDRSFMRNLFEALPGVDTERALQRIDHLQQWALVGQETQVRDFSDVDIHVGRVASGGILGVGVGAVQIPRASKRAERGQHMEEQTSTSPLSELSASGLLQRINLEDIEQQASWQAGRPYPEIFLGASIPRMGVTGCVQVGRLAHWLAGLLALC